MDEPEEKHDLAQREEDARRLTAELADDDPMRRTAWILLTGHEPPEPQDG